MAGESLLTDDGDTTTTTEESASTEQTTETTTTEEVVVEKFDADGKPSEDGTFDKNGKELADEPVVERFDAEGKPSEDGKFDKDGNEIKDEDDKGEGAPESYEDFTMPEGVEINEADLGEFHEVAKDLDLTQDQAQKLVDFQSKRAEASTEAFTQSMIDAHQKQNEDWVSELKADKDFGGDDLDKNIGLAVKVTNKFGSPELKAILDSSGMGNNPELIKMFNRIGKSISEDSLDSDSVNPEKGDVKSAADVLYPDQGKS